MLTAPSLSRFKSPFISSPLKLPTLSSSFFTQKFHQTCRRRNSYPCIKAVDLDQNTVLFFLKFSFCVFLPWLLFNFSWSHMGFFYFFLFLGGLWCTWQVIAITVGVLSVAIGVGIPVFYETQIDNAVSFKI